MKNRIIYNDWPSGENFWEIVPERDPNFREGKLFIPREKLENREVGNILILPTKRIEFLVLPELSYEKTLTIVNNGGVKKSRYLFVIDGKNDSARVNVILPGCVAQPKYFIVESSSYWGCGWNRGSFTLDLKGYERGATEYQYELDCGRANQ